VGSGVLVATFVPQLALLIAFHFRPLKMKPAEDILNFFALIFRGASIADIAKRLVRRMQFN
jgi:hypothetical protein